MGKLDGRVAIITGASRGIGRDMALVFGREGAKVVAAARTVSEGDFRIPGSLTTTVDRIRSDGGEALAVRCDVTSDEDMEQLVARTIAAYGKVDILVNNGAIRAPGSLLEMQLRHWELIFRVNVRGPWMLSRLVTPHMAQNGWGHIINISSGAARLPAKGPYTTVNQGDQSYGTTKAALERMSQAFAQLVWDQNIGVNVLLPAQGIITEGGNAFRQTISADLHGRYLDGEIFGDAGVIICNLEPRTFTGNIMTDNEIVLMGGGNLAKYPQVP